MRISLAILTLSLAITACTKLKEEGKSGERIFEKLESEKTSVSFVNKIEDSNEFNIFRYRNFYNGGGVAIGDINNDGLPDIYFTANMGKNRLYLNKGNFQFEDITDSAGVGGSKPWDTGVLMVDINHDGLLDIYVCNAGNNEGNNHENDLYINNGNLTFTERAADFNVARSGFTTHASFFDYDKDGDLDIYILNNSNVPVSSLGNSGDRTKKAADWENVPKKQRGVGHMLLRNDKGRYVDVSDEAGIYGSLMAFGLGVLVTDINNDTYPDIYVCNDFYERDYLYVNQRNGTFSEELEKWISHTCLSAMGVDIADINNDGLKEIFITDMMPETDERTKAVMEFDTYDVFELKQSRGFYQQYIQNTLQFNNGNNSFSEIAYFSGVARTDWSWSGLILDMDNDGYRDIYVTNGIIHDLTNIDFVDFLANEVIQEISKTHDVSKTTSLIKKMPATALSNYAFKNNRDLTFKNATEEWGLEIPSFSNGSAYGDLDNDGDLDLVVNNVNMESFIFRNNSTERLGNKYLQLQLVGEKENTFAIGAVVTLYVDTVKIVQELMPSRGFQSSVDYIMSIGLGAFNTVDSLKIIWPDNKTTQLKKIKTNQRLKVFQSEAMPIRVQLSNKRNEDPLFKSKTNLSIVRHQEDYFDDFNQERLLTKLLSKEGPTVSIGDINKDGNEDVFIGGAKGQPGTIYLHDSNGNLRVNSSSCFNTDAEYEDTASEFFDADNDGDLDLAVGSGGNIIADKTSYITRLYLNDGKGKFTRSSNNLPSTKSNISVVSANDFDGDGDADLFIGSRSVPGVYGANPQHLLLLNDGSGNFTDGTDRYAYALNNAGMITDAKWIDIDKDKKSDLITVSEWGVPIVFKNSGKRLNRINTSLDSLSGWWKTLETADLDGDGDEDLIIGNSGTNIPYPASKKQIMKLWINDFDGNGTIEQITTSYQNNGDYPIHMRKELTAQLPFLKKQNLKASDYSKRRIQQLFKPEIVNASLVKSVDIPESIIAINEGNGKFSVKKLPAKVQWSCVCGIACVDINKDGQLDLVMGGNNYDMKPQFSRQDANYGSVLINKGHLDFNWVNYSESGFFIQDQIRHIKSFSDKKGKKFIIAVINGGTPKVYEY